MNEELPLRACYKCDVASTDLLCWICGSVMHKKTDTWYGSEYSRRVFERLMDAATWEGYLNPHP